LHWSAHGFRSAVYDFEHSDGVVFLPERRTAYENNIVEVFELDCSIDAKIGPRAFRERLIKSNLASDRSLLACGIHARDVAIRDAVASVDRGFLTNLNVLCLRLRNFYLRL